jgi:HJR/Mrr/RecB family endonuclease
MATKDSGLKRRRHRRWKRLKLRSQDIDGYLSALDAQRQQGTLIKPPIFLAHVIEGIKKLTPELILYLKVYKEAISAIPWQVFEHLVAEFLAAKGFEDVRLVGRDARTSADIYAAHTRDPLGTKIRFFVEVKRTREAVGIGVINSVLGAMLSERARVGWHAALIVATGGFRDMVKFSRQEISMRGVELADQSKLLMWLEGYQPTKTGLWLPCPERSMPENIASRQPVAG